MSPGLGRLLAKCYNFGQFAWLLVRETEQPFNPLDREGDSPPSGKGTVPFRGWNSWNYWNSWNDEIRATVAPNGGSEPARGPGPISRRPQPVSRW
jgi:hypothetical protein